MDAKVIRVTKDEYELDDGRVFPHLVELDSVPSTEEFQAFLDSSRSRFFGQHQGSCEDSGSSSRDST